MNGLTRMIVALLLRSTALLPADRQVWARALCAEAYEIPDGWPRLAWLAGGTRWVAREAALGRRLAYPSAFAAAAAGTAWTVWWGPSGDPAVVINRVDVIAIAIILAALPWAIRRTRGPMAASRRAKLLRIGGYAAVLALVVVKAAVERVADAQPNNQDSALEWVGEIVFLAVMAGYAALILACTARRSLALPATVGIGTSIGAVLGVLVYALGPLGFPLRFTGAWPARLYDLAMALSVMLALCAPMAAGLVAARRARRSVPTAPGTRQGAIAGLCAGTAAALVVAVLSTATIALLPHDAGLRNWAAEHVGQWTPVAGQVTSVVGARLGYVAGNSAFAAGYLIVLLLSPLFGCGFGAWAGWSAGRLRPARPGRPGVHRFVPRSAPPAGS